MILHGGRLPLMSRDHRCWLPVTKHYIEIEILIASDLGSSATEGYFPIKSGRCVFCKAILRHLNEEMQSVFSVLSGSAETLSTREVKKSVGCPILGISETG